MIKDPYEDNRLRVQMLPLMDIIFILLAFLVYSMISMVEYHGFEINLPKASNATVENRQHISLTIDKENNLFVENDRSSFNDLIKDIMTKKIVKSDISIYVVGDKRSDLGTIIKVLDILRSAGIDSVSFECKDE